MTAETTQKSDLTEREGILRFVAGLCLASHENWMSCAMAEHPGEAAVMRPNILVLGLTDNILALFCPAESSMSVAGREILSMMLSGAISSHEDATEALADRYARRSRLEPAFAIRDCHDALMRLMGALHVADALLRDRVAIDD